jgi:hypothetical protein
LKVGSHTGSRAERGYICKNRRGVQAREGDQATATRRHKRYSPTVIRKGAKETRTTERREDTVTEKDV